jgi:hypothetical protein
VRIGIGRVNKKTNFMKILLKYIKIIVMSGIQDRSTCLVYTSDQIFQAGPGLSHASLYAYGLLY